MQLKIGKYISNTTVIMGLLILTQTVAQSATAEAIADCMKKLMYTTQVQKPFPGWICVPNDVNCRRVRVRTEISQEAAARACQNADGNGIQQKRPVRSNSTYNSTYDWQYQLQQDQERYRQQENQRYKQNAGNRETDAF